MIVARYYILQRGAGGLIFEKHATTKDSAEGLYPTVIFVQRAQRQPVEPSLLGVL